jgi:hypothetical protein
MGAAVFEGKTFAVGGSFAAVIFDAGAAFFDAGSALFDVGAEMFDVGVEIVGAGIDEARGGLDENGELSIFVSGFGDAILSGAMRAAVPVTDDPANDAADEVVEADSALIFREGIGTGVAEILREL